MLNGRSAITERNWKDARAIWEYHRMGHELRPCSAAVGLGSHDLGVANFAADLYHRDMFPVVIFSGATSKTTAARFPRGEAVHYREQALALDVPDSAILVEPNARNTGQNIEFSRALFEHAGIKVTSLLIISKPYMERRSYATCRKVWPDVEIVCASESLSIDDYLKSIGDYNLVIDMLVGDLQRIVEYPKQGFSVTQDVPSHVGEAYERLLDAGFDSRLL